MRPRDCNSGDNWAGNERVAVMTTIETRRKLKHIDVHVGARVKSRSMQMGLSQTKLANKIGITFQQVQKYEKGVNRIGASRIHQIASILEVPPHYLFESPLAKANAQADHLDASAFGEFCASRDGLALMQAFVKIKNKTTRHKIVKLVEDLAD